MENSLTTYKSEFLSPIEVKAIEGLPDHQRKIVLAKNEARVIDMEGGQCLQSLFGLLVKAIELSGQKGKYGDDPVVIQNVAKFVYNYCLEKHKGITLSEVNNAFDAGVAGEFGDYVGFGVSTFTKFINGYMTSQRRADAMKEWMKAQDVPLTTERPVADLFKINLAIAETFFEIFDPEKSKMYGTVYTHEDDVFYLPSLYDFLRSNFLFYPMEAEKEGIVKTAKIAYNEYIKKSGLQKSDPKKWEALVDSVKVGTNRTFDNHLKTEALKFCFAKLKSRNKTLKDLKPCPPITP